jgi:hypothetical protein
LAVAGDERRSGNDDRGILRVAESGPSKPVIIFAIQVRHDVEERRRQALKVTPAAPCRDARRRKGRAEPAD